METLVSIASSVFWGLVTLSVLVFIHEGGHFLAARACGVRVTEFFLGLPCRLNLHHVSRRIGTKFGVTPILLGGYAAICGMEDNESELAPAVLSAIHRHGEVDVETLASELSCSADDVLDAFIQLMSWGSIEGVSAEGGSSDRFYPTVYRSLPRDAGGNTVYDGRAFARAEATGAGESWTPPAGEHAFYERERSRTYLGMGFWRRAFMLVAGVAVNIVCGLLLIMSVYSIIGFDVPQNVNVVGSVTEGSPIAQAGLSAGDAIVEVDGTATETWLDVVNAIDSARERGEGIDIVYTHEGKSVSCTVAPGEDGLIGIQASYETVRLNPIDSARVSLSYIAQTASGVAQLLQPTRTMEVLDSSTSIVGISVMSAQAAAEGPATYLTLAALISLSLGCMNLLPIPPLDGGKLLIEAIQAITRRRVPARVQAGISYVGVALFCLLFVYMLRADILRLL